MVSHVNAVCWSLAQKQGVLVVDLVGTSRAKTRPVAAARCLLLAIRAKLEAVETGISTIESEFMAFVVMPNGQTIGERLTPMLTEARATGTMQLLPEVL